MKVIEIERNQQNKVKTTQLVPKGKVKRIKRKSRRKMPVFDCICGAKILIVPDMAAMNKAIKSHIIEHKEVTGQRLTEETLTREILKTVLVELCQA